MAILGGLFSREYRRPLLFCAIAVTGAVLYGYDGTYFTGILAMNKFIRDYGTLQPDGTYAVATAPESLLTSIVQAGEFFGALLAGSIIDFSGRKGGFLAAAAFVTLGVILQLVVAGSVPLLGVGRAILGMGVGIISNAVPLYLSEIPPAVIRGAVVSCWQLFLAIGQVIGACVDQGTKEIESTASYRIPIGLNLFIVGLLVTGTLFVIPESPRWLLSKNRDEAAQKALTSINKDSPDCDNVVMAQMDLLRKSRAVEMDTSGGESRWSDLFHGTTRRRLICVVGILVSQQIGGVQFIFSYTTVFLTSLNLGSPFLITIVVDIVEVIGVICSFFIVGRFGRRQILLWTSVPMVIVLLVCGGLGCIPAETRSSAANSAIAACIIVYVFLFNLSWGPLAWVCAAELAVGKNRQKIMAVGTACFWLSAFLITFTLPYLYNKGEANLNAKVGFVYAAGSLLGMACVYWLIPETRGRTLEQINVLMEMDLPTLEWEAYVFPDEDMSSENGTVAEHEVGFKKEMLEDKLETTTVDGGAADRV